jgi:hypothetical protein
LIPRDTEVKVNDSTYLNCTTSLLANHVQWRHGKNYVFTGIAILEPYNDGRFSVEIDIPTGACNLVIRSVQPSDAGTYECTEDEGIGQHRTAQLIVLGGDPVCKSNMRSNGVIGPNSCGIEPEEVELSCSIKYHGNSLPVLQWRVSGVNQCIPDGRFKVTPINNEVIYSLTIKGSLDLRNSSFICQTTRTSQKHYSCSSDAISSLYVLSSEVTVNVTINGEVKCVANTSQSCTYKWEWFGRDNSSTESDNQTLKPKKVGMHRCQATCSIRNKSCSVASMYAKVYIEEARPTVTPESTGQHPTPLLALLALLIVPVLAVIGVILMYCWRNKGMYIVQFLFILEKLMLSVTTFAIFICATINAT